MLFAETLFVHGNILTMNASQPVAVALAVRAGKIIAVGRDDEVAGLRGPGTRIIDLERQTVVPGFHDAHCHILLFGLNLIELNVRETRSIAQVQEKLAERVRQTPAGQWIRGGGYNENLFVEERHPSRAELDAVAPDHPVFLTHVSGHMGVVNTRALALAGITASTPSPAGGEIGYAGDGEPNGLLKENAQELIKRVLPPYTLAETKAALAAAGQQMAAEGITSAQDAWAGWIAPQEFRAYQETSADMVLPQRVWLFADSESLSVKDGRFDFAFGLHTGFGHDRLKIGAMKFFLDGSLIGRTAAISAPYTNAPDTCGFLVKSEEEIRERVRMAHAGGWQVAMHAIGDRAIEAGLDAIEACMGADARRFRPRLEHCGILRPDLIERLRRSGAVIVTQPQFIAELGDGFRAALGEERLHLTYPLASLRGLPVALSSDRPVVNGAPLSAIQAAVLQRTASGAAYVPEEAILVEEALRWYTLGGAYAAFAERSLGSLEPGKWADCVILAHNPLHIPTEGLAQLKIRATLVGGQTVFGALEELMH